MFMLVVTVALGVWTRVIARQEEALRASRSRVGHLLKKAERSAIPLAAIRVDIAGTSLLYGRIQGTWRCREYHLAPADTQAIESLFKKLAEAEGMVHTDVVAQSKTYGINTPETIRVSFCGPKVLEDPGGDVLFAFDIGKAIPGRDGAFVRRRGTKEIWGIDSNPRIELTQAVAPGLPPMLEKGCLPKSWSGWSKEPNQIFVDHAASGYELHKRAVDIDPAAMRAGEVPWTWIMNPGPTEFETASGPSHAYSYFLQQVPYVAVLPREERERSGVDSPVARVTVAAHEGDPLEVHIGKSLGDGTSTIWVPLTQTLYLVQDEIAQLLAPEASLFASGSDQNPWDEYLRKASGTEPHLAPGLDPSSPR